MDSAGLYSKIPDRWWLSVSSASLLLFIILIAGCAPQGSSALATTSNAPYPAISGLPSADDSLRIRIFDLYNPTTAVLKSDSTLVIRYQGTVERLPGGTQIVVTAGRAQLEIKTGASTVIATAAATIRAVNHGAISITVNGLTNRTRSYTGSIKIRPDRQNQGGLVLVNQVPMEDYVAAVVATEYGLDDVEGARAMAILARTYALRSKNTAEEDYDHVDHSMSQVFHGVGSIDFQSNSAANSTRGMILVHNGALVESVYHASSGGHTANNEDVWNGAPVPYLRGRKDRYESSPYASWSTSVDRTRLLRLLSNEFNADVRGVTVEDRSADGRVQSLDLHTTDGRMEISANDFRLAFRREFGVMSLKSTLFRISKSGDKYIFEGSGFGHGVGLSQWGAHEMAKKGKTYPEILAYYYRDVDILTLEGLTSDPKPLAPLPVAIPDNPVEEGQKNKGRRTGW